MSQHRKIPFFPLALFKLPGEVMDLHIFEPRYRQLIDDLVTGTIDYFGIPSTMLGKGSPTVGCLARLKQVKSKFPDGCYDISIEIVGLFEIIAYEEQLEDKLYAGGLVKDLAFEPHILFNDLIYEKIAALRQQYPYIFPNEFNIKMRDVDLLAQLPIPDTEKIQYIQFSHSIPLQEKFITYQLRRLEIVLMQQKAIYKGFCLN